MDNQNLDQKVEAIKSLAEENNKILRGMKRSMQLARFFSVLKWVVVIGGTVGIYYYFQPMVNQLLDTYSQLLGGLGGVPKLPAL